jgi:hypothetical protein
MQEYKQKFIWKEFLDKIKEDAVKNINKSIEEMIVDSSDKENVEVDKEEKMPNYNSLYNETFMDDNDMILDD